MAEKFLKQYEILLIKGKEDLVAAKYLLDGFNNHNLELNLEIIFFHLQQSSEKLIKALLDFNGIKFPRTHDLGDLIQLMRDSDINIDIVLDDLIELSDFAVEGRYAIINDDLDDSEKYISIIENLLSTTKRIIYDKI